ncbi:cytochrome P450 [Amycolatopsis sp. WQ 127309]|uniref:cytochrome P450 n=1 Tax=Amycolatopsis sp. WQ 127309 TaxID=2932773 RepID=UPI001FF5FDE8|nr:cytochrome P450 [Amycolatopsis sp. WQ 127309]UOZ02698.1 cytochrome P450 [Amycolatopsis sp. WQ 127309]
MTTSTDSELEAQLRTARAGLTSLGALGDRIAALMLGPEDPYPVYAQMRARGPVQKSRIGIYAVLGRDIADSVLRDRRFGRRTLGGYWPQGTSTFDNSFLAMDPPEHTRLRKLAMPAFSPKTIGALRPDIEQACRELLDAVDSSKPFDLMEKYAKRVPCAVIATLFGIPESRQAEFDELAAGLSLVLDGVVSLAEAKRLQDAVDGMTALFTELLALRVAEPGTDLVSRLLQSVDGDKLTAAELVAMCGMLSLAGTETTVNLIGNGTLALLEHPGQWDLLRADPDLAPKAVEEALRYDTSVLMQARFAHEEVELGGKRIPVDSQVTILTGACNRDPDAFDRPDVFDLQRPSGPDHISFSSGIHYCLGAPLARLEGDVAFRVLLERFPNLQRAGEVTRRASPFIRGLHAFPVTG